MSDPLVSVITPSFNQGRWIGDNLASVAAQTYAPIEHVIADGGSTDQTLEILRAGGDSIDWISEPDEGQSDAINKAFRRTSGEIIGWINSDDAFFHTRTVEHVVAAFAANPDAGVVYGHSALISVDNFFMQVMWAPRFSRRLLRHHNFIVQPSVFLRRDLFGDEIVDPSFESKMDRALWLDLAGRTKFVRLPEILSIDRHHVTRKALAQGELAENDQSVLDEQYALPTGPVARAETKAIKVGIRLCGARQVLSSARLEPAFPLVRDSRAGLMLRQLGRRRRSMPGGLGRADD
jgi:glycosyltransferase involved in cell wall biosynthesis